MPGAFARSAIVSPATVQQDDPLAPTAAAFLDEAERGGWLAGRQTVMTLPLAVLAIRGTVAFGSTDVRDARSRFKTLVTTALGPDRPVEGEMMQCECLGKVTPQLARLTPSLPNCGRVRSCSTGSNLPGIEAV